MKYRRLTRQEAAKRGVSYSAKLQVPVGKKVTARTKLISNRQAHNEAIRLRERTLGKSAKQARKATKESYAKSRRPIERTMRNGRKEHAYYNLSPREMRSILRKHEGQGVVLLMFAEFGGGGASGAPAGHGWRYGLSEADAGELLDPDALADYEDASGALTTPTRYGVIVR
jgi:hypothetical protein